MTLNVAFHVCQNLGLFINEITRDFETIQQIDMIEKR
jgi:hypothetical protein